MPNILLRAVALARAKPMLAVAAGGVGLAVAVPTVGRLRRPAAQGATTPAAAGSRPQLGDPGDLYASERAGQNAGILNALAAQSLSLTDAIARAMAVHNAPQVVAPGAAPVPLPIGPVPVAARPQPTPAPVQLAAVALAPLPAPAPVYQKPVYQAPLYVRPAPVYVAAAPAQAPAPAPVYSPTVAVAAARTAYLIAAAPRPTATVAPRGRVPRALPVRL